MQGARPYREPLHGFGLFIERNEKPEKGKCFQLGRIHFNRDLTAWQASRESDVSRGNR